MALMAESYLKCPASVRIGSAMFLRLLGLAVLAFPFSLASATAQFESAALEEMKIDLWPEYDRPSTLVMYRFRLKAGFDLSAPVGPFRVPNWRPT